MPDSQSEKKYNAFISYRHADNKQEGREWATWLHQALETYEVPSDLVGIRNGRGEVIPPRIYPIFRDEEELPADADLGKSIVKALDDTRLLVVLCSPNAVASKYVADEIDYFKKQGHSDRIIAAIIAGEPNASWDRGKQENGFTASDECFPVPLQFEYDIDGHRTEKRAEPIAADFRINVDGNSEQGWPTGASHRRYLKEQGNLNKKDVDERVEEYQKQQHLMLLKIIAGILGIPLGDLTKRDKEYQLEQERAKARTLKKWLTAVGVLSILAVGAGVFAWFQSKEVIVQEEIAEGERDTALMNESIFLMDQAKQANDVGTTDVAILLALNALPGSYGGDRPLLNDFTELRRALSGERKAMVFQHSGPEGEMLEKMVQGLVVSPDGKVLATANSTSVKLWSLDNGKILHELTFPKAQYYGGAPDLIFNSGGNLVLMSLTTGTTGTIYVWDVETGENKFIFNGIAQKILIDGNDRLLTKSDDGTNQLVWRSIETGQSTPFSSSSGLTDAGHRFNMSKQGGILASIAYADEIIKIWSTETGALLNEFTSDVASATYYLDPTGAFIVAKGQAAKLWSTETGRIIGDYSSEGAAGMLPVFSPDGKKLLLPISFSKAEMISTENGEILYTVDGGGVFLGSYFSPKSDIMFSKLATGYPIMSVDSGETLSSLSSEIEIGEVIFSNEGDFLVYADVNGAVSLWPLNQQSLDTEDVDGLIELAINSLPINRTCLTPDEREQYSLAELSDEQWIARGCPQFTSGNR